jgi:hypothetical protein
MIGDFVGDGRLFRCLAGVRCHAGSKGRSNEIVNI